MLLGKALDDLSKSKYKATIIDKLYKLEEIGNTTNIQKDFYFEAEQFLVRKQEIAQPDQARKIMVLYPQYQKQNELFLPLLLNIEANQNEKKTTIDIDYKTVTLKRRIWFSLFGS